MITMIASVLYATYLVSCIWFFVPSFEDFTDTTSWVWNNADFKEEEPFYQFLVSFYWAFQTLLTIGYGDIVPHNQFERMFAVMWMIFGVGFYSYMIGNIINMINEFD